MKDISINPVPSCHCILLSLTTPRRVPHSCDSKKSENRAEELHTSATCVRNLLIVKTIEHDKFKDW